MATTKRNIKAVINHYFPGLKVSVKISGEIWKEKFIISWEDGPSVQMLRDTCKELAFFLPACYHCADIGEDYGHFEEDHTTAPWREAYGQALGDIDDFKTVRTLSDEGKQEAEALAARYFANFDPKSDAPKFAANLQELINMAKDAGFYKSTKITNIFRQLTGNYYGDMYGVCDKITGEVSRRQLADVLAEYVAVTVTEKEKADRRAAEFRPRYGEALRKLRELTGVGNTDKDGDAVCFFTGDRNSRRRLTIAEAVERLEQGEAVAFGTEHNGEDGRAWYWGKFAGGYKTQDKRAEKFAAAGLTIRGHVSPNSFVSLHGIAPEFAAAIRADLQDIEKQRKQWEQEQTAKTSEKADNVKKAAKTDNTKQESREASTSGESEPTAEGLTMEKYSEKATVIRGYNEQQAAELEALGGKECRKLRGGKGYIFSTRRHGEALAEWFNSQTAAPSETEREEEAGRVSEIRTACADLLGILSDITEKVKRFEGVTVPAETLAKWREQAENEAGQAAGRLCEVCACLASLTPKARQDFDALGVIFWTLSEQLRNGTAPEAITPATEYAAAQLYDLIDRTQTPQQAAAIREATQYQKAV